MSSLHTLFWHRPFSQSYRFPCMLFKYSLWRYKIRRKNVQYAFIKIISYYKCCSVCKYIGRYHLNGPQFDYKQIRLFPLVSSSKDNSKMTQDYNQTTINQKVTSSWIDFAILPDHCTMYSKTLLLRWHLGLKKVCLNTGVVSLVLSIFLLFNQFIYRVKYRTGL